MAACSVYGPCAPPSCVGPIECRKPTADQQLIPQRAVLIEEQDRLPRRAHARPRARRLNLHQRDQAVHLGLLRREPGEDAPEPQRVLAERRPHPVVAGGGRVALVEDRGRSLRAPTTTARPARRRAALRTAPALRRASAWRGRCAARSSAPRRGTRARSPRSSAHRAGAA